MSSAGATPNPILLKIRWTFKEGRREDFVENQKALCKVMEEHPGVVVYHVDYPEGENYSEWTELYNNDATFKAHLANPKGKDPLGVCIDASAEIECRCWGKPDDESKEILAGFGTVYKDNGENSFALNPNVDTGASS